MNLPAYVLAFWALYAIIVVPSAFFNRVAAVMVGVRLIAQLAYNLDVPEPPVLVALYVGALGACALLFWRQPFDTAQTCAAVLFLPLATNAAMLSAGALDAADEYWLRYGMATLQALIIPFGNDWGRVRGTWTAYKRERAIKRALRMVPC